MGPKLSLLNLELYQMWWHIILIPRTQEVEAVGFMFEANLIYIVKSFRPRTTQLDPSLKKEKKRKRKKRRKKKKIKNH